MTDLDFTPLGFEAMDAGWWPATANSLSRPWPREAVLFDLRWWRGQEIATAKAKAEGRARRVARMPGRPALCQRWGWPDWDARMVLKAEAEWRDTWTKKGGSSSGPPAVLQRSSSPHPAAPTENAENSGESSSVPPASLQQSSSNPPHARQNTVSPITDHRDTEDTAAPAASPCDQPGSPDDTRSHGDDARRAGEADPPAGPDERGGRRDVGARGQPDPAERSGGAGASGSLLGMPDAGADRAPRPDRLTDLWTILTAWTPKPSAWKLTEERRKHLAARVRDFDEATVERVGGWVRTSSHERAVFLRQRGDVSTLLRRENFATYAAMSEEGLPRPAQLGGRPEAPTDEAERAWRWICDFVRSAVPGVPLPAPATPWEHRARSALQAVRNGGWNRVKNMDDYTRRTLRDEFVARWNDTSLESK